MATQGDEDPENLPKQFDLIYELHQFIENTDESTSSDNVQGRIRKGIQRTESAIEMVNQLDLFSRNEDIDEVSTNEMRYMMLSAFLGYFCQHNTHMPRIDAVKKSKICFKDFLSLSNSYNITDYKVGSDDEKEEKEDKRLVMASAPGRPDLNAMASQRNNKIQRFKEKKMLESKMSELKSLIDKETIDDEVKRDFYTTQLKHWANFAVDEIDNCDMELQMLAHRESLMKEEKSSKAGATQKPNSGSKVQPFRPFILTKTQLQKQVYGAGYPALPSLTVDEFYEQKLKEGTLSESAQGHSMQKWAADPEGDAREREQEDAEKEEKIEKDDLETLIRARTMDEWKDEHRRGDGNRHNKG